MERTFQTVRDELGNAFQRAKQVYDGRVKRLQFKVDDLVWFFYPRKRPHLEPKLQLLTTGPWKVERVLNSVNFVIRRVGGRDRRIVHVDLLQRYVEAAPDGVVLVSQPAPNRLRSDDVLTNQRSHFEAAVVGGDQRWLKNEVIICESNKNR